MSFREMVAQDNVRVFGNTNEFADLREIVYDGERYKDVHCILTKLKEKDRTIPVKDHAQGFYLVTATCHFPKEDLDGHVPENGSQISITDDTGFDKEYYVVQSSCDLGMVRLELEEYDE